MHRRHIGLLKLHRAIARSDTCRGADQQLTHHSNKEATMKTRFVLLAGVALLLSLPAFAESPFDGTWKLNTSKSNLAGDIMHFADAGSGMLKYTDSDQTYTFKPDGSSF